MINTFKRLFHSPFARELAVSFAIVGLVVGAGFGIADVMKSVKAEEGETPDCPGREFGLYCDCPERDLGLYCTEDPSPEENPNLSSSGNGGGGGDGGGGGGDQGPEPEPQPPKGQVLGTKTAGVSSVDRNASDFIPNKQVPAIVERIFAEVFGRKITHAESVYWKSRARGDKATESKLKGAMSWHKSKGSTGVKPGASAPGAKISKSTLISRINAIFRSVYGRNPAPSENRYWLTRINDKPTEQAMKDAMLFHHQRGIGH